MEVNEEPNKPDTLNAHRGGPLTPKQREAKQKKFLKAYREIGIIKAACKVAGINRSTYYDWAENDEAFKAQLPEAKEEACETLEIFAFEQARGIEEPAVSMGRIVYEEIPVLDEEGNQTYDVRGHPVFRRGRMVMVKKYSPSVLITLLKANMPEKYKEHKSIEHSGKVEFVTEWGGGALEDEESEG